MQSSRAILMPYEFTTNWFTGNIPNWTRAFNEHVGPTPRVLEVGSFEGLSTCWLIERLSKHHGGGEIFSVDPWVGNDFRTQTFDMSGVEKLFHSNVGQAQSRFPNVTVHQMKEFSKDALSLLMLEHAGSFDMIYVDGDHTAKAALTDLVLSHYLCKEGGLIIVDDYLWDYEGSIMMSPKPGVDAYTTIFADEVYQLRNYSAYQVFLKKRTRDPAGA